MRGLKKHHRLDEIQPDSQTGLQGPALAPAVPERPRCSQRPAQLAAAPPVSPERPARAAEPQRPEGEGGRGYWEEPVGGRLGPWEPEPGRGCVGASV